MTHIISASSDAISQAAAVIQDGGLVGMPTETVYGLAANARDGKAVARIFEAKGRPQFNPLIVHVNDIEAVQAIAYMSEQDMCAAQKFWPGPLTLILRRREDSGLSDLVSAGLSTVAVRIPSHKTARALIEASGVPIAAPSANRSGTISTTTPAHVAQSLGNAVDMIIADGASDIGVESTVLDCIGDAPCILRPGGITAEELSEVLGCTVQYDLGDKDSGEVKSPGQLLRHYAPRVPVRLNAIDVEEGEALLTFGPAQFMGMRGSGEQALQALPDSAIAHLSKEGDLYEAASNLFAMLHQLDLPEHKAIAVMNIPDQGVGVAINDRLCRAAKACKNNVSGS
ncbi:MAG: threonylcarbamoyl-AMP synthase [Alphaproteobacteria bacterium]|nr:threonylcarbamoyl-AMP synthase [Alphaproteobacteria bacterium]